MKKVTKIIAAIMLVAIAAVGAYASAQKSQAILDVFYINSADECVEAKANTVCVETGTPNCTEDLLDPVTEAPLGISSQIFRDKDPQTGECEVPYHRP